MIAIIKTGGKQYAVKAGQILKVEKLLGKKGDNISLNNVIALTDSSNHTLGNPLIKGATVDAKILDQIRDKKIIVFKKRRRQNYRSTQGHRQHLTVLKIESINHEGKKITAPKTEKISKEPKVVKKDEKKVIKKTVSKKKSVKKTIKKKTVTKKTIKNK
tara:strand:+ start:87 stop:563 length:477 start_codon:yes stop_codon:yes gene_type:complete